MPNDAFDMLSVNSVSMISPGTIKAPYCTLPVACIRDPFEVAGAPLAVTASVGVATYEGAVQTAAEMLALADRALYRAKKLGRDRFALV